MTDSNEKKTALWSWSGKYPEIHDERDLAGERQELLHRAIFQGDDNYHWFCSCNEFAKALRTQISGTPSNIANQKPLECVHIREIMQEKGLTKNVVSRI